MKSIHLIPPVKDVEPPFSLGIVFIKRKGTDLSEVEMIINFGYSRNDGKVEYTNGLITNRLERGPVIVVSHAEFVEYYPPVLLQHLGITAVIPSFEYAIHYGYKINTEKGRIELVYK